MLLSAMATLTDEQAKEWIGEEPLPDEKLTELYRGLLPEALAFEELAARPREKLTIIRPEKKPKNEQPASDQPTLL